MYEIEFEDATLEQRRAMILEDIALGKRDVAEGRVVSHEEARRRLGRWLDSEYNHGYPGTLKAVLDLLLKEYIHKAVAFVGVSAQVWGGTRVIEALLPTARELGLAVTFTDLNFPRVAEKFDAAGNLLDEAYEKRAKDFLHELVWMSRTLKWGRQNLPSKFH